MKEEVSVNALKVEPVAEPASNVVAGDEDAERDLIGVAQASGQAADYQAYLDRFLTGIFAELETFEFDIIAKESRAIRRRTNRGCRCRCHF
jgi:hypothetical protein